jgi:uncharacterized protein
MLESHNNELTKGCKLCAKGQKLVLFITGICPRNCIYCPLSKEKKNKDVTFANEWQTSSIKDLIKETKDSNAKGAGITGGDPLAKLDRTLEFIKTLKKEFGKSFHLHLYTSLQLLTKEKIRQLEKSGLDELRVHPDLEDKTLWPKISLLKETKMETVVEIPSIPGKENQTIELIEFAKDKVRAFNINQLEQAPDKEKEFLERKWIAQDDYSIKGSEELAIKLVKKFKDLRIHYCSARFKDEAQFSNRILNHAKNVALPSDKVTSAGTLLRGVILSKNNSPQELEELKSKLEKTYNQKFYIDKQKFRIICSAKLIRKIAKKIKNCAIVEEYPTHDKTEIYFEKLL